MIFWTNKYNNTIYMSRSEKYYRIEKTIISLIAVVRFYTLIGIFR